MENQTTSVALTLPVLVVVITMLCSGAMAQSSCTTMLISLSPCLTYITGNSSTPPKSCCNQLATVVGTQPQCLCEVLNNSSSLGISINQTQALALPAACNVHTPPTSHCNAAAPSDSPSTIPSGRGSNTVPSTDNRSSARASTQKSIPLLVFLIFIAHMLQATL